MHWYFDVLQRYSDFTGRANRSEFWMFFLLNAMFTVVMRQVGHIAGVETASLMYTLIVLTPTLAVGARRLHDTGLSGWWQLAGCIPYAGIFVLVFLYARAGMPGDNRYGPEPLPRAS